VKGVRDSLKFHEWLLFALMISKMNTKPRATRCMRIFACEHWNHK